jgi:hypothetical protein
MRTRLRTYTAYSIGCAAVWAVILIVTRRVDSEKRDAYRVACIGWLSASIARVVYPPPKRRRSTGAAA